MSRAERQQAVERMTSKCRLPADRITVLEGNQARVRPDANDSYESVDCLLTELKSMHGVELGFVGNEAYSNEVN